MDQDKVQGQVIIKNRNAPTPMDHLGVFIEFVGKMERVDESSTCPSEFISIKLQLVPPSESPFMGEVLTCPFDFGPMKFQFASYEGVSVAIRYGLRVSFGKRPNDCFGGLMIWCPDSNVHDSGEEETETFLAASPATHDLGLEGALRIQIFVENTRVCFTDVIRGRVEFATLGVQIIEVEAYLAKREYLHHDEALGNCHLAKIKAGDGPVFNRDICHFEVDLASIPASELTASMESLNNTLSVRYFVGVMLKDTANRRYYKQIPIELRKGSKESLYKNLPSYRFGLVQT